MPERERALIDWNLAVSAATRVAGPGPAISATEASEVVSELRAGANRSTPLVRDFSGLVAAERTAPVLVVDRAGWIVANTDSFATLMDPLTDRLMERKGTPGPIASAIGSRVTGLEVGGLLGFLSSKVLGQFDPYFAPSGRLLLVAPNVVHVERELKVDPTDFRLWVCLHEETHRVQFTAVPWLGDHIRGEIDGLLGSVDIDPATMAAQLADGMKRISEVFRSDDGMSLLDLVQTAEQKVVVDRLTAVMSLLEGHADVVMDGVGPEVISSVSVIRRKFNQRRKGAGGLDRVLRRLLGLEAKMAQYRNGAAFVRSVVAKVGMEGFNQVWSAPDALPTKDEIAAPEAWVRRVHG